LETGIGKLVEEAQHFVSAMLGPRQRVVAGYRPRHIVCQDGRDAGSVLLAVGGKNAGDRVQFGVIAAHMSFLL
jgi:hypothetical protein